MRKTNISYPFILTCTRNLRFLEYFTYALNGWSQDTKCENQCDTQLGRQKLLIPKKKTCPSYICLLPQGGPSLSPTSQTRKISKFNSPCTRKNLKCILFAIHAWKKFAFQRLLWLLGFVILIYLELGNCLEAPKFLQDISDIGDIYLYILRMPLPHLTEVVFTVNSKNVVLKMWLPDFVKVSLGNAVSSSKLYKLYKLHTSQLSR